MVQHSQETDLSPSRLDIGEPSPPTTQASGHSGSSVTTPSTSSRKSNASSFAHMLRDNRADRRLFKKTSKPSQHLQKSPAVSKQPPIPKRSASYYKPKVVEDTATVIPPTAGPPMTPIPPISPGPKPPRALSSSPTRTPIRKARSSPSQSESASSLTVPTSPLATKRPPLLQSGPHRGATPPTSPSHHVNVEASSESGSRSRDSSPNRHTASPTSQHAHPRTRPGPMVIKKQPRFTPPEGEPRTPYDTTDRHGDHYFRTFGTDTVYQKEPSPPTSPFHPEEPKPVAQPETPGSRPQTPRLPSDLLTSSRKSRKRSSILAVFRHADTTDITTEVHKGGIVGPSSSPANTPDITVSSPQLAKGRARSTVSSYFSESTLTRVSAEATPHSAASGLSTHWEDLVAESQPAGHVKEISEPMSPLSLPQPARPKPLRAQGERDVPQIIRQLPEETIIPVVPSGAAAGPQLKYKSSDGREYYKADLTGPNALSFLPSEMKRVNTPPVSQKPSVFKGFFFDMRSIPTDQESAESESPEAKATKRRSPIFLKSSFQSLLPKVSLPKLKRKISKQHKAEPEASLDPLEVTGFQQTPYSQRYGDTRRAKMSQIRSYVEETLREDDDEMGALTFELNVPDHLPNSPLCPLSPKHKSGGKAICPIHRRKKMSLSPVARRRLGGRIRRR